MLRQRMSQEVWDDFYARVSRGEKFSSDFICVGDAIVFGVGLGSLGREKLSPAFRQDPLQGKVVAVDLDWLTDTGAVEGVDEGAVDDVIKDEYPIQLRLSFRALACPHILIEISEPDALMLDLFRTCIIMMKKLGIKV